MTSCPPIIVASEDREHLSLPIEQNVTTEAIEKLERKLELLGLGGEQEN